MSYVLYCFSADWCQPCKRMKEPLQRIQLQYPDVTFESINIEDDNKLDFVNKYQIKTIPSYVLVKNSQEVSRVNGANISNLEELLRLCH